MPSLYYRYRGRKFLTSHALIELHEEVLLKSPGVSGIKDYGALESASQKPRTSAGDEDAYPTFFSKVAAQGFELTKGHVFSDGNKRTAFSTMIWTLSTNGYDLQPSEDAGSTVMLLIALNHLDIQGIRMALIHWCDLDVADESL